MNALSALSNAYTHGRLSHALLIKIRPNDTDDLKELVSLILCANPKNGKACGSCESCQSEQKLDADVRLHPDLLFVQPETEQAYMVDQVREWTAFLSLKPNSAPNKILIVPHAEKLSSGTMSASNALLKVLEEPRPNNFIFLLTEQPLRLISTIRSRTLFINIAQKNVSEEFSDDWKEIIDLLRRQKSAKHLLSQASFWKNRGEKIHKLEAELQALWQNLRKDLATLPREEALKRLHAWKHLEDFVWAVKHYGNASLHWLDFKMKVQESKPWKRSKLFG